VSINKWTEDQLDLVEVFPIHDQLMKECVDQVESKLPEISSMVSTDTTKFSTMQATSTQLRQRINAFNDQTKRIYDAINKLRYAYSSADGLKEKMSSVESVMEGISARMNKLNDRLEAVEKTKLRYKLERRYRIRWMIMTGVCVCAGLLYLFRHLSVSDVEKLDLGGLEELLS
jgi:septation ring formation regulator EzrA